MLKNGEDEFYKCEEIITETEDGFLLTVHRLPNDGPPVLLQHGLLEHVLTPRSMSKIARSHLGFEV